MINELKNVPELRFPEFDGEWEEKTIGKIATTFSGGTPSSTNRSYYNGEIPFIRSGEISKPSTELMINKEAISNSSAKMVEKGDLLYALYGATSGEVAISKISGAINQAVLCIRSQESATYIFNYLKMKKDQILKTYIQGGQGNLSASIIKKVDINLPYIEEQEKIGTFFSKLDRQIELEEQKLAKLEEQKKGYMQKVFSQELRFKDENGNNYPEWEEKELGDVATIVGGGTPNTKIAEYWNGDINWFSPVEIGNDIFVNESKSKITELGLKKSSAKLLPTGTVLFTSRAGIGKTAILNSEACTNQGFQSIVPNQSMLDSYYIYSRTNQLKKYAEIVGSGSTFIEVSGVQMRKMPIMLPSITEQEKIGVFFKKIDDSLKKQSDKIGLLKQRKKGFLQKMFV